MNFWQRLINVPTTDPDDARRLRLQTGSIVLSDTAQNLLCNQMMQEAYLGGADVCETPL